MWDGIVYFSQRSKDLVINYYFVVESYSGPGIVVPDAGYVKKTTFLCNVTVRGKVYQLHGDNPQQGDIYNHIVAVIRKGNTDHESDQYVQLCYNTQLLSCNVQKK